VNYRHAFHAGNFADVFKHTVLARIVVHLKEKPAAFRVIDTHAGAGGYDLTAPEPNRTAEWRDGIGKLMAAEIAPAARDLLAPYLDAVAARNGAQLKVYPGSPLLVQSWLRPQDRLIVCEREAGAAHALMRGMRGDNRVKAVEIDGYTALNAYVPPKERRGVVMVDPPFEQADEFDRLAAALAKAHRKWPTGIYVLWYPAKDARRTEAFMRHLARLGITRILRAELALPERGDARLRASGLVVVNPPWKLEGELAVLLPALAAALAGKGRGKTRLSWLAGEK
jgi:23S rRNA (adenine2030-N6)-methyltransferase